MRKSSTPSPIDRRNRWKQHLRDKRYQYSLTSRDSGSDSKKEHAYSEVPHLSLTRIARFFSKMSISGKFRRPKSKTVHINMPKNFCIYSYPEKVLQHCWETFKTIITTNVDRVEIDHTTTQKYSLGAEVLFAISAREANNSRAINKINKVEFQGANPTNSEHLTVINSIGIISELDAFCVGVPQQDARLEHVFKDESFSHDTASSAGDDKKNRTATEVITHLRTCLHDHKLKIELAAIELLRGCIAEILDNAIEHSGLNHPAWFIRSYLNNNNKNQHFELCIFNFGNTISETFSKLDKNSFARKTHADPYAKKHKGTIPVDALYSVVALQGRVSSKNENSRGSRGQGTIALIEAFEKIFSDYVGLRGKNKSDESCVMNIISGRSHIHFDGTYSSKKIIDPQSSAERVIYPFNHQSKLAIAPDSKFIKTFKKSFFQGTMINIKLPLTPSTVS
jgi:hypothetical protein